MSTSKSTLAYLEECLSLVPGVTFKPMMGEYCVYSDGRIFGLVCEGTLFLKTTPETISLFEDRETKAYPGSKNTAQVNAEWLENREELARIVKITLDALPIAKPKKKKY
jgi:TfoX/Sxy family transcriptional regulator of competence genes